MRTPHSFIANRIRLAGMLSMIALCGTATPVVLAEDAPAETKDESPLKGPEVKDRDVPGGSSKFGDAKGEKARDGRGNPVMFGRAVRSLNAPDAPESLRISAEQMDEIDGILGDFREEMEAFRTEHKEQIKALREKAGLKGEEGRGEGKRGERVRDPERRRERKEARANATPEQQEARQELKALMEKAPKFDAYQTRVWDLLSAEQRDHVKATMEEMRERGGEMMGPGPGPGRGRGRGPEGDDGAPPRKGKRGKAPKQEPAREMQDDMMESDGEA